MDRICMLAYCKLLQAKQNFLEEERGAVDIVAIVVLIGVAVALALLFKDQIGKIMNTLFGNINTAAGKAADSISGEL